MTASLKAPRRPTVVRLFAVSMNRCAFPGCDTALISPTGVVVGQVAHIKAQNSGGPRYDDLQTDEQRHGFGNLILLCAVHHLEIDARSNLDIYTVERLSEIKQQHEDAAVASGHPVVELSDAAVNGFIIQGIVNEPSVHMDFRHAVFKVGGEGGQPLGSGGNGGVLTIVGVASLPPEAEVDLDGKPGQFPGGGGGGGGALRFEGRPITAAEVTGGVCVSSFFTANATTWRDGLFNALDGGCTWHPMPAPQQPLSTPMVIVLEVGSLLPNELLRLDILVELPSGIDEVLRPVDIRVADDKNDIVRRACITSLASFAAGEVGKYTLRAESGGIVLASYSIEVR
ncbi:hypothetical protein [Rhodococcus sp. NPDC058639]|uniref:hypothetical protein n=1 Tax=Rhodococcus sp. NPDC058639 TaxID=3346570 RepID=UPI003649C2EE